MKSSSIVSTSGVALCGDKQREAYSREQREAYTAEEGVTEQRVVYPQERGVTERREAYPQEHREVYSQEKG